MDKKEYYRHYSSKIKMIRLREPTYNAVRAYAQSQGETITHTLDDPLHFAFCRAGIHGTLP